MKYRISFEFLLCILPGKQGVEIRLIGCFKEYPTYVCKHDEVHQHEGYYFCAHAANACVL